MNSDRNAILYTDSIFIITKVSIQLPVTHSYWLTSWMFLVCAPTFTVPVCCPIMMMNHLVASMPLSHGSNTNTLTSLIAATHLQTPPPYQQVSLLVPAFWPLTFFPPSLLTPLSHCSKPQGWKLPSHSFVSYGQFTPSGKWQARTINCMCH